MRQARKPVDKNKPLSGFWCSRLRSQPRRPVAHPVRIRVSGERRLQRIVGLAKSGPLLSRVRAVPQRCVAVE